MVGSAHILASDLEVDALFDKLMFDSVDDLNHASPLLANMAMYHMGWLDSAFHPVEPGSVDRGKRFRPKIALLACQAVCGSIEPATRVAAAIELLHNFTLIHDDIQDASLLRRHRETVWSIWGIGQAINVGDALFAASHRLLLASSDTGVPAETVLRLAAEFDRMTIDIVGGQVMDLRFENGNPVSIDEYLEMIRRKTAAIMQYAAWSGAIAGGSTSERAGEFGTLGEELGIGFQIRDDVLGVWGQTAQTGKAAADDIRRKKQSLPIILLRESISTSEREELGAIFARPVVIDDDIRRVLQLMDNYAIQLCAEKIVRDYHDRAEKALEHLAEESFPGAMQELRSLVSALSTRQH